MSRPRTRVIDEDDNNISGLNDIYTPYRLTRGAWNEVESKGWYTPRALMNHEYRRMIPPYQPREHGWLTLAGKPLGAGLFDFLDLELVAYRTLSMTAFECGHRQLDWALCFASLSHADQAEAMDTRPVSAAELLSGTQMKLLGLVQDMSFVEPKSRHGAFYPVIKMPVNPDPMIETKPFLIDASKALELINRANAFDALADNIERQFDDVEDKMKALVKQRKTVLKPYLHKTKYFDPELLGDANIQLAGAVFYRARALADFLRKMVYINVM